MIFASLIPLGLVLLCVSIGVGAIVLPKFSAFMYGAEMSGAAFVRAAGVRDLFIGFILFELWREDAVQALGLGILALGVLSAGDAAITWGSGNRKRSPMHFAAAVLAIAYAIIMLRSL